MTTLSKICKEGLPIGANCVFYMGGDVDTKPIPAQVQDNNYQGHLDLATFPLYNLNVVNRKGVRHASDETNKDKPQLLRKYGCWETVEAADERRLAAEAKRKAGILAREERRQKRDQQVASQDEQVESMALELHDKNMKSVEIAEELSKRFKYTINFQKVNAILRKHSKVVVS